MSAIAHADGVLFVVSATVPPATGQPGPRKDYFGLQHSLDATLLDYAWVDRSRSARMLASTRLQGNLDGR